MKRYNDFDSNLECNSDVIRRDQEHGDSSHGMILHPLQAPQPLFYQPAGIVPCSRRTPETGCLNASRYQVFRAYLRESLCRFRLLSTDCSGYARSACAAARVPDRRAGSVFSMLLSCAIIIQTCSRMSGTAGSGSGLKQMR